MKNVRKNWKPKKTQEAIGNWHRPFFLPLFTAVICIAGCASGVGFMTLSDAANLRKGMSVADSKSVLPHPPKYEFSFDSINESGPVLIDAYYVVSGDYSAQYILAFSGQRLLYWGYPHEFARSKDAFVNAIGEQAVARLREIEFEEAQERQQQMEQQQPDGRRH